MIDIRDHIVELLLKFREQPDRILLYPHVGADGDALGSSLALHIVLKRLGLNTILLLDEPVSLRLRFLPHWQEAVVFKEEDTEYWISQQTLAIAVDCADGPRTGRRQVVFDQAEYTAALDHHVSSGESRDLLLIDSQAAATAEIIFDLICDLEQRLDLKLFDKDIATLLMAALVSDTGRFVYSNTTARSFSTAASLMAYSPDLRTITYQLYDINSQARLRLTGRIFSDAQFYYDGKIAMALVDQALLEEYQATEHDLEGIVSQLRNVDGVEVSFVLRQLPDGKIRVNIRSSDGFNASEFARKYGGGGHPKAAGMTLDGLTLQAACEFIKEHTGSSI